MNLLVTGAAGFVGSNLIKNLFSNHAITAVVYKKEEEAVLKEYAKKIRIVCGDVTNHSIKEFMAGSDVVLHLAGITAQKAKENPTEAILTNIYGTHIVFEAAKQCGIKKFIFASSYYTYGTFVKHELPLKEDTPLQPDEIYGMSKAVSECEVAAGKGLILRFSNIYGYGTGTNLQQGGVISTFIKNFFEKKPITIYGSGKQKMDYIYIDDLTNAVRTIIEKEINSGTLNIGGGKPVTIIEIAKTILNIGKKSFDLSGEIKKVPAEKLKIWPDRWMSIEKAKKEINWQPTTPLYNGIKKTMEDYYNKNKKK